jgi:hypothetical protein
MESPLAPEPMVRASLRVLFVAGVHTRNWTLNDEFSRRQLNVLWEALHPVPSVLARWPGDERGLDELRTYFAEADWMIPELHLTEQFEQALLDARGA